MILLVSLVSCAILTVGHGPPPGTFPRPGEWTCYRGNGTLDARTTATGEITTPEIAWRHFVGAVDTLLVVEPAADSTTVSVPLEDFAASPADTDHTRWGLVPALRDVEGRLQPVENSATVAYGDVLPDVPGLEKLEFESAFNLPTVDGQCQPCVGRCFAWEGQRWVQVWETAPLDNLFSPLPIVGDFDNDGRAEVAILPWSELLVLDGRTGVIEDRCRFTTGRSYGFFGVYDIDGDGMGEFVVQADFAKHVDVLGYRNGKLTLLWQREIELDISNAQKILRVNPNPVADVDGDGMLEVLVNLYDGPGDGRWHLTVHDGMTGGVKADLPDEYLQGVADVDGDSAAELLTTHAPGRGEPAYGLIMVRSVEHGEVRTLWHRADAGWQTWDPPLPAHVNSGATFARRTVLCRSIGDCARVVIRERVAGNSSEVVLSVGSWVGRGFKTGTTVRGPQLEALAIDATGSLLVRCTTSPGVSSEIALNLGQARTLGSNRRGVVPGSPVVVWDIDRARPVVVVQSSGEELIAFNPPRDEEPGVELWRIQGRGQSIDWPGVLSPVVADLSGDGRRQLLYATAAPDGCARLVASDLARREIWHHDFPRIPGTAPVWNTGGIILWQVGRFADRCKQDVLVTVRRSMMHTEETFLLSGRDGHEIWHRDRQIRERGVGGTPFAIADYDGDGLDDIASFHPSIFYILKGSTGENVVARNATWRGVPAKPVYWGIPVAGDFENNGSISIFFATTRSSMTGVVRLSDEGLVWWDALDTSPRDYPAFGDFNGDGRMEAVGIGYEDGIRCYDTATGKINWRMPVPAKGDPVGTASADIDGDGRDEALFVIGKTLYCVGTRGCKDAGSLLWEISMPAHVGPPAVADVDGSGKVSVLLVGDDGYVYCVGTTGGG